MCQIHVAGEKLFVDYAGQTVPIVDPAIGEITAAQIFVATLGASNYTYACATRTGAHQRRVARHRHLGGMFLLPPTSGVSHLEAPAWRAHHHCRTHSGLAPTLAKALAKTKAVKEMKDAQPVASQPASTKTPLSVVQPPQEAEYTDLDAARDQVEDLQDALVVANTGVISEEDKGQAATLIQDMQGQIKLLKAMLRAVKPSRDTFQAENAQLRIQFDRQRREFDRVTGRRTA